MRKRTIYEVVLKRPLDFILSLLGIIVLLPVYIIVAILVWIKLGAPVIFKQHRPGKNGKIFKIYKFRSMTNKKDESGNLLPDEQRLTKFGSFLRKSSLDEIPGLFNILMGKMSIVGPRPQLIDDMFFMTEEQNRRHLVKPGVTGLAQVSGRNDISWEDKLSYDIQYIGKITFWGDIKILFKTVFKVFKSEGVNTTGMATAEDLGVYLLRTNQIDEKEYKEKLDSSKQYLDDHKKKGKK